MTIQELRIGSLVDYFGKITTVVKMDRIGSAWYISTAKNIHELANTHNEIDAYSPITLTEEWLLKFGFYKEKYMFYFKYGVITYALCADNHGFVVGICNNPNIDWFSWEIKYVHQLQNLYFALTGSELVLSTVPEATKPAL